MNFLNYELFDILPTNNTKYSSLFSDELSKIMIECDLTNSR